MCRACASVTVEFTLPRAGDVRLEVFDAHGRRVRALADEPELAPGLVRRSWDGISVTGARVAPGLYFVRLNAAGEQRVRRVVVVALH